MNTFDSTLQAHGRLLRRAPVEVLQLNLGRLCNQTCRHCHVDAAPWRTETMDGHVAQRVIDWIAGHRPAVVDLTGGAPELNAHFRALVEAARAAGCHVIDRNNLTILETEAFRWLPEYLAAHQVEIVASLPCYLGENVDAQRGDGVFEKSIRALRTLNAVGYGSRLPLNLVFNPIGPTLPPPRPNSRRTIDPNSVDATASNSIACTPSPTNPSPDSPKTCADKDVGTRI